MFGLGITEILIVGLIILVFVSGRKLPQIGGDLGKAISNFRHSIRGEDKKEEDVKKIDQ